MALLNLEFSSGAQANISLREGDLIYYVNTTSIAEFSVSSSNAQLLGPCVSIAYGTYSFSINVEVPDNSPVPSPDDFVFFAKNNEVDLASLKGYHGVLKMKNTSTEKAELFSVSCETVESSK